ncbi:hypothetical protein HOLleu_37953 [Holothuria leucospilota]|uniref:Uncharacterized protein n=1 Tax=Holothuria leucospilota TaxID=206669 RepID=A0A9Q1BFP9_HOLLE|nr:hypothetical protein HOLleu_37953 [Holothuria leucospilota]
MSGGMPLHGIYTQNFLDKFVNVCLTTWLPFDLQSRRQKNQERPMKIWSTKIFRK